ncbi:MAG TPA: lysophospholipid acyltransferase family protein [Candidatus Binatia bacterium]|nr:lysophospholipid acyltransferase family protein [Candidatus Binatia bacterium]
MLYAICKPIAVAIMKLLFRLEAHGTEHVPATGPVLLVANHSSVLDPPLVGGMTPRRLTFLAKAELFGIPGFGWLIRRLGAQPLRREGADPSALRTAQRVLQAGGALLVFPEGTRGEEGVLREAKPGAALLAMQTGVPVVPVYVRGSGGAWPRGRRLPRPVKVVVTFGPALTFARAAGADRKAQYEAASRRMMAAIGELKDGAVRGAGVAGARRPLQIT